MKNDEQYYAAACVAERRTIQPVLDQNGRMVTYVSDVWQPIFKALGLDHHAIISFTLRCSAEKGRELAQIEIQRYEKDSKGLVVVIGDKVAMVLEKYDLVLKERINE